MLRNVAEFCTVCLVESNKNLFNMELNQTVKVDKINLDPDAVVSEKIILGNIIGTYSVIIKSSLKCNNAERSLFGNMQFTLKLERQWTLPTYKNILYK